MLFVVWTSVFRSQSDPRRFRSIHSPTAARDRRQPCQSTLYPRLRCGKHSFVFLPLVLAPNSAPLDAPHRPTNGQMKPCGSGQKINTGSGSGCICGVDSRESVLQVVVVRVMTEGESVPCAGFIAAVERETGLGNCLESRRVIPAIRGAGALHKRLQAVVGTGRLGVGPAPHRVGQPDGGPERARNARLDHPGRPSTRYGKHGRRQERRPEPVLVGRGVGPRPGDRRQGSPRQATLAHGERRPGRGQPGLGQRRPRGRLGAANPGAIPPGPDGPVAGGTRPARSGDAWLPGSAQTARSSSSACSARPIDWCRTSVQKNKSRKSGVCIETSAGARAAISGGNGPADC